MKKIFLSLTILFMLSFISFAQNRIYSPELFAPANEAIEQTPDVLLDWLAVTGEGTEILYDVQLADNIEFNNAVLFSGINVTSLRMNELHFGSTYYWRVRAIDALATSDWSAAWSFAVSSSVLIMSPTNLALVNPDVTIKWKELTGISGYDIQVDTSYSWAVLNRITTGKINDVFQIDENHVWFVGDNGLILQKLNNEWNTISGVATGNLFDVFFVDNENGWIVGDGGKIFYYNGIDFTAQQSGLTTALNGVFFTDANNGFAVGKGGKIIHYDGENWTPMTVSPLDDLFSVHGNGPNNIWAVGKGGKYAHFNGTAWTAGTGTFTRDMNDVWVTPSGKVWVAAKAGRIYSYDNSIWSEQIMPGSQTRDLQGVCFLNDTNGYIVGNNGTLLYFNGVIWQALPIAPLVNLNGIHLINSESGYIAGDAGTIIKYQGEVEGFNSPYLHSYSTPGDILEFKLANLLFGQAHYFRIRAKHAADTSDWSIASSFKVIDKPVLLSPDANATNISLDTLAKWQAISGVAKYTIQLSEDAEFTNPRLFESTTNEYRFDELVFSKDYFWRVNARHAVDISDWSDARKFSTANSVTLTSPSNGAINVNRLPRYEWKDIKGTEKYMIQHGEDITFAVTTTDIVTDAFYQTIYLLDKVTTYYWRVKAIQGLDSTNWSQVRNFITEGETSIDETNQKDSFTVFPNPGNGLFLVSINGLHANDFKIEVFNLTGSKVFEQVYQVMNNQKNVNTIDLKLQRKGMYLLRLTEGSNIYTKRIVIE